MHDGIKESFAAYIKIYVFRRFKKQRFYETDTVAVNPIYITWKPLELKDKDGTAIEVTYNVYKSINKSDFRFVETVDNSKTVGNTFDANIRR